MIRWIKKEWPGPGSNRRHADFQSQTHILKKRKIQDSQGTTQESEDRQSGQMRHRLQFTENQPDSMLQTIVQAWDLMTDADKSLAYSLARRALGTPVFGEP